MNSNNKNNNRRNYTVYIASNDRDVCKNRNNGNNTIDINCRNNNYELYTVKKKKKSSLPSLGDNV